MSTKSAPFSPSRYPRLLRAACVLALIGLALVTWSVLDPRPLAVVLAKSLGQAIGTASLALFLAVVAADLVRMDKTDERRGPGGPPSGA